MGLLIMIAGLALFIGAHVLTTLRDARAAAIARLGEGGYKIVYSLVSFAGIALAAGSEDRAIVGGDLGFDHHLGKGGMRVV